MLQTRTGHINELDLLLHHTRTSHFLNSNLPMIHIFQHRKKSIGTITKQKTKFDFVTWTTRRANEWT